MNINKTIIQNTCEEIAVLEGCFAKVKRLLDETTEALHSVNTDKAETQELLSVMALVHDFTSQTQRMEGQLLCGLDQGALKEGVENKGIPKIVEFKAE